MRPFQFALLVGLVAALAVGAAMGFAIRWIPGLAGGSLFEVASFLRTARGFESTMLALGLAGAIAGWGARARWRPRTQGTGPAATLAWPGAGEALVVGAVLGLVLGWILFGRVDWLQSRLGPAGSWEARFALAMAVLSGLVSGIAGFATALGHPARGRR